MSTTTPLVTDPSLQAVLAAAEEARTQSLAILDTLDAYHASTEHSHKDKTALETELTTQQKKLTTNLAKLRGLNRKAVLGVRSTKAETGEARQEIDALHLQLQNLYYEQRHLRGEIEACADYEYEMKYDRVGMILVAKNRVHRHVHKTLPLIPIEEFLAAHPEYANSDEHELTIARIQDEHAERQKLEDQRQVLLKKKDAKVKEVNAKKEELGKLDAEMEKWIAGESNVRKIFEAREKKAKQAEEKAASKTAS